jgi:type III restriction enzyme
MKARDVSQATVSLPHTPEAAPPASWVEKSPEVCGGDARIRKTRITVWSLIERRNLGLSDAEILRDLPDLKQGDLDAAWSYYEQHREEINQAIRENAGA